MTNEEIDQKKREIETLKLLQHPNIIRLLDVFETYEYIWIVTEFYSQDLYSYFSKRNFKMAERRVADIIHSIATGIFYLHNYGIIHCDLKLDSIMMVNETENSDIKISFFGLARMIGPDQTYIQEEGTLGFTSPEALLNLPLNKKADIWNLGVITYLLLSGTNAFDDEVESEIIRKTTSEDPEFSNEGWANITNEGIEFTRSKN